VAAANRAPAGSPAAGRLARIERKTRETQILLQLNVDGTGEAVAQTTIPFLNHMLEAMGKHGLLDVKLDARGDTDVDLHHTVEDVGICLGKAFHEALGDKRGIVRYGTAYVPMDEALASVHVDISGRPYFSYNVPFTKTKVGNFDLDLLKDFFRAFAMNAMLNLHVNLHYGENLHHIAEAIFKAFGRALAEASRLNPRIEGVLSTKGAL
jgi:imidazoleglycerol-phosphate dehydratase